MKILAAIANYGQGNRQHLERLIAEYRSMPWPVDVVVLSNIPKILGADIEVRVGLPDRNPWSLPFAHRPLFAERLDRYDLFVYSEDDTLVRAENIQAFLEASAALGAGRIPGFLRTEAEPSGRRYVSSMHGFFRWKPEEILQLGADVYVPFSNDHAASYVATRGQLAGAIASGGFLVQPHEGRYDMLCSAATDVYTRCGLKRYICVSRLSEFLLPHLPNKYLGRMGVPLDDVLSQVSTLIDLARCSGWRGPLCNIESGVRHGEWSKNLYDSADPALLALVPETVRTVLSIGAGAGALESLMEDSGLAVSAIPLDPVFGGMLRRRGIRTIDAPLDTAMAALSGERFDAVLAADLLHLVDDPIAWLKSFRQVTAPTGHLLLSVPHTADIVTRAKARLGRASLTSVRQSSVRTVSRRRLRSWLRAAGYDPCEIRAEIASETRERISRASLGWLKGALANRFIARSQLAARDRVAHTAVGAMPVTS